MPVRPRGSAGGWRHGRIRSVRVGELSVGPQHVLLDGSNYRGARGADFSDLKRMANRALRDYGADTLLVATLIRNTSENGEGFTWISHSGRDARDFLNQVAKAEARGESMDKFAERIHATGYEVKDAITWTIIAY